MARYMWSVPLQKWRIKVKRLTKDKLYEQLNLLTDKLAHQQRFGISKRDEEYYKRRIKIIEEELRKRK